MKKKKPKPPPKTRLRLALRFKRYAYVVFVRKQEDAVKMGALQCQRDEVFAVQSAQRGAELGRPTCYRVTGRGTAKRIPKSEAVTAGVL